MTEDKKPKRTEAATAARMRGREEKAADLLTSRGWRVEPPESENSWQYIRDRQHQLDAVPPTDR